MRLEQENLSTRINYSPRSRALAQFGFALGMGLLCRKLERGSVNLTDGTDPLGNPNSSFQIADKILDQTKYFTDRMHLPEAVKGHTGSLVSPMLIKTGFETVVNRRTATWGVLPFGLIPAVLYEVISDGETRIYDPDDVKFIGIGAGLWVLFDASAKFLHDHPEKVPILGGIDRLIYRAFGIHRRITEESLRADYYSML